MKRLALFAISSYQRHISPYKGFCCAYSVHTGHVSCSVLGYRAVKRYGVLCGVAILRRRFERCSEAHRRGTNWIGARRGQRGECDLPCECLSCDLLPNDCDAVDCCDAASCDWPSRKKGQDERPVYVPPPRRARPVGTNNSWQPAPIRRQA